MNNIDPEDKTAVKLRSQAQKPQTRAEILRDTMKDLETRIARLAESRPEAVLEIPLLFDQANQILTELGKRGKDLSTEMGQLETLTHQFYKKRPQFIRQVGGVEALQAARRDRQPAADLWWWFPDQTLAEDRRAQTIRALRNLGIILAILTVAFLIYRKFFAPDPNVQASYGHQQIAEYNLIEGRFPEALSEVEAALTYTPDNPDLYVIRGVIQEVLDQSEEAQLSYEQAFRIYTQEDFFYNQRALLYLMMDDPERALADCQAAIQINPDSAISYLNQGQAYELLGDILTAIESYEEADAKAQQTGNAQLQAFIRVTLSNAYQRLTFPTLEGENAGE